MSDFEEYLRQGEAAPGKRAEAWQAAIGLQDVDGLKTSEYLVQTARRHIEGDITIGEAKALIDTYYRSKDARGEVEARTEEADKVAARITEILSEETFSFAPGELSRIHRKLFTGIFMGAGEYRTCNISKKEWVLGEQNELKNRYLHISYVQEPKSKNCTLDCTLEEMALLSFVDANPKATQKQMAEYLHCSERTVKTMTVKLQNAGALVRVNGRRSGWWEVKKN